MSGTPACPAGAVVFCQNGAVRSENGCQVRVPCPAGAVASFCTAFIAGDFLFPWFSVRTGQFVPRMDARHASLPGGAAISFCTAFIAGDFLFPWFSVRTGQSVLKMDARYASLPGGCRGFVLHGVHRG